MDTPEKLKRYQKVKFENYKKVNDLKVNDDEAYIVLKINSLNDIITPYSMPEHTELKQGFFDIIRKKASIIPFDYPLVLEIHNQTFTSSEKILIRKLVKNYFTLEKINYETELKARRRKYNFFLIFGLLSFIAYILLRNFSDIIALKEMLSFFSSFSIWEWAELILFEQDNLKEQLILNTHLSKIRVVFDKDVVK